MDITGLLIFAGACLLMVLTPGPNMVYLLSRSLGQGRRAGIVSLCGVVLGFLMHLAAASLGLTALFLVVPMAYETLRWAGVAYLFYLAWQMLKPDARSPLEARALPPHSPRRLLAMGFLTSALNPKIAMFYLSVLPQFVTPAHGDVFAQSVTLGLLQVGISFSVNLLIVLSAAWMSGWFRTHPFAADAQRWITGSVLGLMALKMATEPRRAV